MKVLFLPYNFASRAIITCNELNKIEGYHAKCFFVNQNKYSIKSEEINYSPFYPKEKSKLMFYYSWLKNFFKVVKLIIWADVIHYTWTSPFKGYDLYFTYLGKKKKIIEWIGSDIRNPQTLMAINPYYAKVFKNGYEYSIESKSRSQNIQLLFYKFGFEPMVTYEMAIYVDKEIFPKINKVNHRINFDDFECKIPNNSNKKLTIVHAPTALKGKGTDIILNVLKELQKKHIINLELIHNKKRDEALKIMKNADIFIDQIILGFYGFASVEAMCFGKPVVSFILNEAFNEGLPINCPIINANEDTLYKVLDELLSSPERLNTIGKASREYAYEHFNVKKGIMKLIEIYHS